MAVVSKSGKRLIIEVQVWYSEAGDSFVFVSNDKDFNKRNGFMHTARKGTKNDSNARAAFAAHGIPTVPAKKKKVA